MIKPKRALLLMIILPFLYSCAPLWIGLGAGVGIGTYKYIEGNLERDYPISYEKAWAVTNQALTNMKIGITNSIKNEGVIDGVGEDGKTVAIRLINRGEWVTTVRVRVGFWGDKTASARIHDEIARAGGL
ncbi:MAG: hypothetical protein Fur0020_02370 [Thermodesulfovibrionia bacterium]